MAESSFEQLEKEVTEIIEQEILADSSARDEENKSNSLSQILYNESEPGGKPMASLFSMKQAAALFKKLDTTGKGYLDREAMRVYAMAVREAVYPGTPFDEAGFEAGFCALDTNNDGKVTPFDLVFFIEANKDKQLEVPASFSAYHKRSEELRL